MKSLLLSVVFCALLGTGCLPGPVPPDYRDPVAVDLTLATMTEPTPEDCRRCNGTGWITHGDGHRTPCPDCRGSQFGGPLDTWRDAKELIRKGNELADRSKALFDQAERDGKIRVDIRLPGPSQADVSQVLPGPSQVNVPPVLSCPVAPRLPGASQPASAPCRPGLLRRWRR